ncbi:uncharacterized protein [Rutidosis leptorrhynchoides]|uniref:uncharacterized protein n=1 Tax=Rutidosis leptorrhynchoides TaxID=125765 RepID=UPI003A99A159
MASLLPNSHFNSFRNHLLNPTFIITSSSSSQIYKPKNNYFPLSIHCSIPSPPKSKEEAIQQVKTCLSSTLQKPLNNPNLTAGKLKKQKQPRFRVEIPVIDDSPDSLTKLALQVFDEMQLKRKGSKVKFMILWPNSKLTAAANKVGFRSVEHVDICSLSNASGLNSADVVVFLTPEASQMEVMEAVSNSVYPKPVVMFNPRWSYDDEESILADFMKFLGSFEVVYSFMGLEVRGLLSKRNGVVFKCVKDGVLSGEKWSVLVEEEEEGALKVITSFKTRPSIVEVENVLYNLMAINSPITKSAKFLKDLVSNVTGKK